MKKTGQLADRNLIGGRIRKARLACVPHVTQEDLAGRLAARGILIDQTAVYRIENQDRYLMDYEIIAIAKALKVSVAFLFGESSKLKERT
jgi:HTH-type transcriptional regulator, cell division transcriptional repressor